jgi:hypothetical protein
MQMDARTAAWWNAVLAGETDEPHPIFGEHVSVRLDRDRLELRGMLERREDRQELVRQASSRIGKSVREVDVSHLVVAPRLERPGLLEQTIVASFSDRATAELARKFVREHGRVVPASEEIIDRTNVETLRKLVPDEYVDDVKRRIDRGEAVLLMRVDETVAFVRGLLEEETRSDWSLAIPPEVAGSV